jgi:acyl carrier protein
VTPADPVPEILAALRAVAPEVDADRIDRGRPLVDQLDIDSMDYLNFLIALGARYAIDIPAADAAGLRTIDDVARYLAARTAAGSTP